MCVHHFPEVPSKVIIVPSSNIPNDNVSRSIHGNIKVLVGWIPILLTYPRTRFFLNDGTRIMARFPIVGSCGGLMSIEHLYNARGQLRTCLFSCLSEKRNTFTPSRLEISRTLSKSRFRGSSSSCISASTCSGIGTLLWDGEGGCCGIWGSCIGWGCSHGRKIGFSWDRFSGMKNDMSIKAFWG